MAKQARGAVIDDQIIKVPIVFVCGLSVTHHGYNNISKFIILSQWQQMRPKYFEPKRVFNNIYVLLTILYHRASVVK